MEATEEEDWALLPPAIGWGLWEVHRLEVEEDLEVASAVVVLVVLVEAALAAEALAGVGDYGYTLIFR